MITLYNYNNQRSVSFGNTRYAGKEFKDIIVKSAEIYDKLMKKRINDGHTLMMGYNMYGNFMGFEPAIQFQKNLGGYKFATLMINKDSTGKTKVFTFMIKNTKKNKELFKMRFTMTDRTKRIHDCDEYFGITPEGNKYFEKYGTAMIKPFLDIIKK